MTHADILYRAFKAYRKDTIASELKKERKDLLNSNVEQDVCNSTKYLVNIESDWIESIEKGLEFVEKAIAEFKVKFAKMLIADGIDPEKI